MSKNNRLQKWHEFYASVKDYEIFLCYPKHKRSSISLFAQGMKKYGLTKEEMHEYVYLRRELRVFDNYAKYMSRDYSI